MPELLLELCAAVAFVLWVWGDGRSGSGSGGCSVGYLALLVIALVIALPVVQLVPLPPGVWTSLPGRDSELAALQLVGAGARWFPWSVAPSLTLAALLSLGPPLLMMAMTAAAPNATLRKLLWTIVIVELCAAFLGALQLASGGSAFHLYSSTQIGWITGFHANRNAAADAFLLAMIFSTLVLTMHDRGGVEARKRGSAARFKRLCIGLALANVIFAVATLLTGSRTGIVLLAPVLAVQAAMLFSRFGGIGRRRLAAVLGCLIVLGAGAVVMVSFNSAAARIVSRFLVVGSDFRPQLWEDSRFVIGQYWPFGSGLGTFTRTILPAERLEIIDPTYPNRAHNDFLELAVEGGAIGLTIAAIVALFLAWGFIRTWRAGYRERALAGAGAAAVIALHSIVDYPLRNMAIACLAGVAAGFLCGPAKAVSANASGID